MITPLLEDGGLDLAGLAKLVEYILAGGVHGLFLLGTTGEGTSLSHRLRKELVTETCLLVKKRVPVLVCITDTSFEESVELAHHSARAGADILVVAAPYYLPISQSGMQDYLELLVPSLPLPFFLYNMPSCTKIDFSIETVAKAKALGALGIKDSSGNMAYMNQLIGAFGFDPKFSIITGSEGYLHETILKGGHGAVTGGANFFPRVFVALYEASVEGDLVKIALLRETIVQIDNTIYALGENITKYIQGIKCAVAVLGICDDFTAPPIRRFNTQQRAQIKTYMEAFLSNNEFTQIK